MPDDKAQREGIRDCGIALLALTGKVEITDLGWQTLTFQKEPQARIELVGRVPK